MVDQERVKELIVLINEGMSNPTNARLFYKIVRGGMRTLGASQTDLADGVDVSRPTVERWLDNRNAPYRALRPLVYKWFLTGAQLAQSIVSSGDNK